VKRSFRMQLALRATAVMGAAMVAISLASLLAISALLDREIDATILNVAAIQAASLTDQASGEMHFHDWDLTPDEAASVTELVSYAQVWQWDGQSLLRSQYMTEDLPLDLEHLRRAEEGELSWTQSEFGGERIRALYYPLDRLGPAHDRHVLQVASPQGRRDAMVRRVGMFLILLSLMVTAGTFAGSWWLAKHAMRPVHEIMDQAEDIGAGSLNRRIQAYADTHEYHRLVDVLNTMLGRIQRAFDAQRRFTADASHELRSPLTAMRGELELALRRERDPDEYRRVLSSGLEEVVRLSRITEDLLILARSDAGALEAHFESVDVADIAVGVLQRLEPLATAKGLRVRFTHDGETTANVDSRLLNQVVWNLSENALKFTPDGGEIEVSVMGSASGVTIRVTDTGPGFQDTDRDRLFARFFRADQARTRGEEASGSGLGLAIVKAAVEAQGGEVTATNRASGGASVTVRLPRSPALVPAPS